VTSVLEQPRGHPAPGETPAERSTFACSPDHDPIIDGFEEDIVARAEVRLFPQILGDHDLSFGTHLLSHTV
jgi:hypothetical protein